MALHASLQKVMPNSHLWIVCIDEVLERQITKLGIGNVSEIALKSIETDRLRAVKQERTLGENCWTLTPFVP